MLCDWRRGWQRRTRLTREIGIRHGKIAAIGDLGDASAIRTIDADGLAVSPGLIDIYNHCDDTLLEDLVARA